MTEHGYNAYTHGCRCEACRAAKADYMRRKRAVAAENRILAESTGWGRNFVPGLTHGYAGYQDWSCRCNTCRKARSDYDAARKKGAA